MNTLEYRNIAEQVLKNKEDILKHFQRDEVLADFGIRIIGQVDSYDLLLEQPTHGLQYGDAYAVGPESPYRYYIWTRANSTSFFDYWFDLGQIAIAGPQGPIGPRGIPGEKGASTRWYYIPDFNYPMNPAYNVGDLAIDSLGNVYYLNDNILWQFVLNIKGATGAVGPKGATGAQGPQGPKGEKGDTGDPGAFINIFGVIGAEEDLPNPSDLRNLSGAYLVGENRDLYIQVGTSFDTANWLNIGPLNVATLVTVGGQFVNAWDADTKVDKVTESTQYRQVYGKSPDGTQTMFDCSHYNRTGSVPQYALASSPNVGAADYGSTISVSTPTQPYQAANKAYVDSKLADVGTNHQDVIILPWDTNTWSAEILNVFAREHEYITEHNLPNPKTTFMLQSPGNTYLPLSISLAKKQVTSSRQGWTYMVLTFTDTNKGSTNNVYRLEVNMNPSGDVDDIQKFNTNLYQTILPYDLQSPMKYQSVNMPYEDITFYDGDETWADLITLTKEVLNQSRTKIWIHDGNIFTVMKFIPGSMTGYEEKVQLGYIDFYGQRYCWEITYTWGTYNLTFSSF